MKSPVARQQCDDHDDDQCFQSPTKSRRSMSRTTRNEGSVGSSPHTTVGRADDKEDTQFKSPVRRASKALRRSFQVITSPLRKGNADEAEEEAKLSPGKNIEEMDQDVILLLLCRELELIGDS